MRKEDFYSIVQESWETFGNATQFDERIIELLWEKLLLENEYFSNSEIEDNHFWIDVKNKSVLIKADEEGIAVDIFKKPPPETFLEEPIVSTWCLYDE
jgi:hypothetical protein